MIWDLLPACAFSLAAQGTLKVCAAGMHMVFHTDQNIVPHHSFICTPFNNVADIYLVMNVATHVFFTFQIILHKISPQPIVADRHSTSALKSWRATMVCGVGGRNRLGLRFTPGFASGFASRFQDAFNMRQTP